MDLEQLAADLHRRFDGTTAAREQALPAARRSIRASANSIRAIHRLELATWNGVAHLQILDANNRDVLGVH